MAASASREIGHRTRFATPLPPRDVAHPDRLIALLIAALCDRLEDPLLLALCGLERRRALAPVLGPVRHHRLQGGKQIGRQRLDRSRLRRPPPARAALDRVGPHPQPASSPARPAEPPPRPPRSRMPKSRKSPPISAPAGRSIARSSAPSPRPRPSIASIAPSSFPRSRQ